MAYGRISIKCLLWLLFFAVLFTSMCVQASVRHVTLNNITVDVEIADAPDKMEKGLMGRPYLGEFGGMLFVFPDEQKRSFWMKNTLIPLDIIFISKNMKIVDIKQDFQPCRLILCASYTSKERATYALEVNANFTRRHNIFAGDDVKFS